MKMTVDMADGTQKVYDSEDEEQAAEFYIGSKDEDGTYYYVQLKDSQQVGRILATSIETLLSGE